MIVPEVDDEQDLDGFRAIYKFDLETKKVKKKPVYLIDLEILEVHANKERKVMDYRFHPSAVAIHPISDEIIVLASKGKALLVMNRSGEIIHFTKLDKAIFPQPEGLCFAPDGTMYISSEGKRGSGRILKFEMQE